MGMIDVLTRVDAICKKYDRYDADKHRNDAADPFSRLYTDIDAAIDETVEKAEKAARETKRASKVTLNAGVRHARTRLMEDVVKLQKLSVKKMKGVSREDMALRPDLVAALHKRIQSIPDGGSGGGDSAADQNGAPDLVAALHKRIQSIPDGGSGGGDSAADQNGGGYAPPGITFDSSAETLDEDYFQTSEESEAFRREYEMRRIEQDEGLEFISEGLDTLKNLAEDMGEELDRQVPLMDEIDRKVDKANSELRKTNVRLKETVTQFRSTRNFTVDIILICIILGIGAYLYNLLSQ